MLVCTSFVSSYCFPLQKQDHQSEEPLFRGVEGVTLSSHSHAKAMTTVLVCRPAFLAHQSPSRTNRSVRVCFVFYRVKTWSNGYALLSSCQWQLVWFTVSTPRLFAYCGSWSNATSIVMQRTGTITFQQKRYSKFIETLSRYYNQSLLQLESYLSHLTLQ